jgi:hypothetical protein
MQSAFRRLVPVVVLSAGLMQPARGGEMLGCTLAVPAHLVAGQPVPLAMTLTNLTTGPLEFLRWNTPFEQHWAGPFVTLTRDGVALPYQGPMIKRADPAASQYLRLAPGESLSASLDLALPFDLSRAGRYRVTPDVVLADVAAAGEAPVPRPRSALQPMPLHCNPLSFELRAR